MTEGMVSPYLRRRLRSLEEAKRDMDRQKAPSSAQDPRHRGHSNDDDMHRRCASDHDLRPEAVI